MIALLIAIEFLLFSLFLLLYDKFDLYDIFKIKLLKYINNDSLNSITKKQYYIIKPRHIRGQLFYTKYLFLKYFLNPHSYFIIIFFIGVMLYFFVFFNDSITSFLTIGEIKVTEAKDILDKRINNLATLSSLSLAVIIFILNSVKDKGEDQLFLIFQVTFIYPTVYFILFSILYMVTLIYFNYLFTDPNKLLNMIYFSYYLMLFSIILIAVLCARIYFVIQSNLMMKAYDNYFSNRVYFANIAVTQKLISSVIYSGNLLNFGLKDKTFYFFVTFGKYSKIHFKYDVILKDVNLGILEFIFKKYNFKKIGYFIPLRIGERIKKGQPILYLDKKIEKKYLNCIINSYDIEII